MVTRGETWRRFFESKGWIADEVVSGGENDTLEISIRGRGDSEDRVEARCESALILHDGDILCHESRTGTIFFQWDDIIRVKLVDKKKSWL
jgi:hypothetical protein